ncbi:MFS transporter [Sinomonas cyclohexanicum]|uniref:MFS transporter n=1 Tax=Sinomonas cyclohexanicum TaxID=322009 RepID=Q3LGA0_SINCY|nr:aromatic acid/H+ symport family MFS transporter [Corynebacterium cyclohexanicum]BAE46570.1 possible 4-hydroxybenzoate transporter [Corynebacterium cyclohexanicum]BCT77989.1 MFS transporter [Corynebacterium cyclohexanicum]
MSAVLPSSSGTRAGAAARSQWPVWLCWFAMVLDGFDLVVLGAVIPTLLKTHELGFDPVGATLAATISLVGVGLGALFIAPLSDRFGRRRLLIACVAWFSVFTLAVVAAPNVALFSAFRLLAGLGLGACLPAALAYINDYAKAGSGASNTTRTMTGYHAGAVATAFLALLIMPNWRAMFIAGGVAGLVLVPFLWAKLPESLPTAPKAAPGAGSAHDGGEAPSSSASPSAVDSARAEKLGFRALLRKPYPLVAIGIAVASFMGLLLVYGLNTWLPTLMAEAGYSMSSSLTLLLVLNVGAVAGLLLAGWLADRHGTKRIVLMWFGVSAVLLAALSIRMQNELLLNAAVFVTGVFVFSAQVLVYAWVSQLFPAHLRGTALGFSAGVGRIGAILGPAVTGTLVTLGVAYPWGFYVFAAAAVLAVLALVAVPHAVAMPAAERADA